jgi:Pectate lyase superfamily protein
MAQRNVTTSGSYLAKALVSPTGGAEDETLADIAQAAISVASADGCGRVELATADETAAGTDATRAVTPAGLAAQNYIKSTDITYEALNDNGDVGSEANQVARGDHVHPRASSTAAGFMSAADKAKLDGIEAAATADQTGAEIVAAIDTELGGSHWQQGGEGIDESHTHTAADLPDRGAFYGKAMGASLTENGGMVDINIPGLPAKAAAGAADLVPIWDAEAAAHRHVPVAGLPADRGIVAPAGEDPAISMELPAAVDRRDFLLGFTATGAVTTTKVATARDVDDLAARGMTTVENIAELCAARPRRAGGVVYVRGYDGPGDGGGGAFMWDAASTKTPDGGTVFAAEGHAIGRWIKLYDQLVNIKSFGAKGDGAADDTAAVQRAVDSGLPLFVPAGRYKLTASITFDLANKSLIMVGVNSHWNRSSTFSAHRSGNPDEPMFHRVDGYMKADGTYTSYASGLGQTVYLSGLGFKAENLNPNGHCLEFYGGNQCYINKCDFRSGLRGLTVGSNNHDATIHGCSFRGLYSLLNSVDDLELARRSWGLYSGGQNFITGATATGYGTGIYLSTNQNTLTGARFEENIYGLILGNKAYNREGIVDSIVARSSITGMSFEANRIAIYVMAMKNSTVSGFGIQGSPGNVDGRPDSDIGVLISSTNNDSIISNFEANGLFRQGAIINHSRKPVWFEGGGAYGGGVNRGGINNPFGGTGPTPNIKYHFLSSRIFQNTGGSGTLTAFSDLMHRGLTGLALNTLDAPVFAKNFGDVVSPAKEAVNHQVNFPGLIERGAVGIIVATFVGAPSTLMVGTYYYAVTIVSKQGETGVLYGNTVSPQYKMIAVAAGERVNVTLDGALPKGAIRRVYRGTAPGYFNGYWNISGNSFVDDGNKAFDGSGMPPQNCNIPAQIEDDENYQIVATPSWATTIHITHKTTTGFMLNFGTAAPDASQTVAWLMFRP